MSPTISILPSIEPIQSATGGIEGGVTSAMGLPLRVTWTGRFVLCTSSRMAKHFALNSAAETCFMTIHITMVISGGQLVRTAYWIRKFLLVATFDARQVWRKRKVRSSSKDKSKKFVFQKIFRVYSPISIPTSRCHSESCFECSRRAQRFQRRIASSLPVGRIRSASS